MEIEKDGQVVAPTAEGTPTVTPAVETPTPAQNPFNQEQLDQIISAIKKAQEVKANAVVKSFGNQNGLELSKEDVANVIAEIDKQKKAQEPDVTTLTEQLNTKNSANRTLTVENAALRMRSELGVDDDTMDNVLLKFAVPDNAVGEDGTVNSEALKTSFTAFLEKYPQFKSQATPTPKATAGFQPKIGVEPTPDTGKTAEDLTRSRFGLKPKA